VSNLKYKKGQWIVASTGIYYDFIGRNKVVMGQAIGTVMVEYEVKDFDGVFYKKKFKPTHLFGVYNTQVEAQVVFKKAFEVWNEYNGKLVEQEKLTKSLVKAQVTATRLAVGKQ